MNKLFSTTLFAALLLFSSVCFSQQENLRRATLQDGKEYNLYRVQEGETLYRISRTFNVPIDDILLLNPEVSEGVKAGNELRLPVSATTTTPSNIEGKYFTYTPAAKETVYSIAKFHGMTVDELIACNPELKDGLKAGQSIKIPNDKRVKQAASTTTAGAGVEKKTASAYIEHTVEAKETLYSISRKYGLTTEELTALNPEIANGLKIGQVLKIRAASATIASPAPTPGIAATSTTVQAPKPAVIAPAATTAVLRPGQKMLRVALLLPFMTNESEKQDATIDKFIEFYEGVLLGLNTLKAEGISVELSTYDIEKSEAKVREVLSKNPTLKQADLIIGPAYSVQEKAVCSFAQANSIPVVLPFLPKVECIRNNPFVFQNNCPQSRQIVQASSLFAGKFSDKNIVIIHFNNDYNDNGSEFARTLTENLKKQKFAFREMNFTQENFQLLKNYRQANKETIVVLGTDKAVLVKDLLPKIQQLNTAETPISVFGFSAWDKTLKTYPSSYYYSPFFVNNHSKETQLYRQEFRRQFGVVPTVSPRFDLMGYDLTVYFVKALSSYGKSFAASLGTYKQEHSLQSNFHFEKYGATGGYINTGVQILHYTEGKGIFAK
ncbi:MAG: LysM peptidoglycan-binding domain-containing protein [Prevotellaceae bacterium]|jgi:LysM repeat protein/ABC-type branched-subunit amino acid transport system substrate-binding protein|nr:LysM peptidoglycan-binding domain-containing protein [Prevotellaceae bacterium]